MGRNRKFSDEQIAEMRRQYQLWRENAPSLIAKRFSTSLTTLHQAIRGAYKTQYRP